MPTPSLKLDAALAILARPILGYSDICRQMNLRGRMLERMNEFEVNPEVTRQNSKFFCPLKAKNRIYGQDRSQALPKLVRILACHQMIF